MTVTADDDRALIDLGVDLLDLEPDELEDWYLAADPATRDVVDAALAHPVVASYATARRYAADPVGWVDARLREHLWSKQVEILEALRDHRQVAVPSCHGVGKSFTAARAVGWWIDAHPPGSAFALTTAPTGDQVRAVLWREINRAHAHGGLPGRVNLSQWYLGNELVAIGRKPSDRSPASLQGIHAEFVLVVIDEADGVAETIFDAASDTLATTEGSRILAIGNPDRSTGPFYRACQPGSDWHVVRISAFDAPAFTGEQVPQRVGRSLVSKTWVAERRRKWGEGDPRWSSKVLGVAPTDNPTGVIPHSAIIAAVSSDPDDERVPTLRRPDGRLAGYRWGDLPDLAAWGLDVAAGGDRTVLWERRGRFLARRWEIRTVDADEQIAGLRARAAEWGTPERLTFDVTGLGWGLLAPLRREAKDRESPLFGVDLTPLNFGGAGSKPGKDSPGFVKVRDELWWGGRTTLLAGGLDLRTLRSPEHSVVDLEDDVVSELTDPTWAPSGPGGRIRVEAKDETKRRLGRSPDDADAILLALWEGPSRRGRARSTAALAAPVRTR